jgi:hypothetical protein
MQCQGLHLYSVLLSSRICVWTMLPARVVASLRDHINASICVLSILVCSLCAAYGLVTKSSNAGNPSMFTPHSGFSAKFHLCGLI